MFFPYRRNEQHQHRIQLQSAGKHVKHQRILRQHAQSIEVLRGSDACKAGSDIIKSCGHCCKIRQQILPAVEHQNKHGAHKQECVQRKIDENARHNALFLRMAVNLDNTDRLWMQILADLLPHALPQNDDAGDLLL